ncbi:hypothetical protein K490DRAFT_69887 [Saccharata proteae CBS 121410]|uniref:Uncharacterized protein n=1 Tax=Saccharata proteae CBS 121410 TaxID=1314787 RepID=A0A9P4LTT9_9PEZI|nr:hypothetical protein K490DRAFT_69887 [Saccharata proteae CBS 121410]
MVQCSYDNSSFQSPGKQYRPKFRYCVPNGIVQQDVAHIADVGCGGLEFVPCYQYGLPEQNYGVEAPTNWSEWGFGTEAYRKTFLAALQSAQKNDMLVDFSQAASEGQGVPSEPGTVGLAMELAHVNFTLNAGEAFNGTLPLTQQPTNQLKVFMQELEEFGNQKFHAVVAAELLDVRNILVDDSHLSNTVGQIIDLSSFVDHDHGERVKLNWKAPSGDSTWRIIAFYERYTNQRSVAPGWDATNSIQNGSWIVDHFSANGSKRITDFFEEFVVPDEEARSLLSAVGNYAWEDSMEMHSALWWTPGFADTFGERRGYDIAICLPLLIEVQNYWDQSILPYCEKYSASNTTFAIRCSEDYQKTLNEGYQDYLEHFQN